jgi:site-specific DNA recombinase
VDPAEAKAAAAKNMIAECDQKLARYRAALDAGADPVEVTQWINTTRADRARAEGELRSSGTSRRMTQPEIITMMSELGDLASIVIRADPADKADLYRELGLNLTYRPQKQLVEAKVIPGPDMCNWYVSEGGLEPPCPVKGTSTSS